MRLNTHRAGVQIEASDPFDMILECDMLKKLYELSHLYDIEFDVSKFGLSNRDKFTRMEMNPKPAKLK